MKAEAAAGPGVRVPPPVFYLAAFAIGIALEYLLWPIPIFGPRSKYVIASILIIASVLIMPPVLMRFRRAATPFDVRKAASSLITDGPLPVLPQSDIRVVDAAVCRYWHSHQQRVGIDPGDSGVPRYGYVGNP